MSDLAGTVDTASILMNERKRLLATDESTPTRNKRFAQFGIAQTPEMRTGYRELIIIGIMILLSLLIFIIPGVNRFLGTKRRIPVRC